MSVIDDLRSLSPLQTHRGMSHPEQLWRASMLAYCPRKQILAAKGVELRQPDWLLRKFSVHSGAHDNVQDWFAQCLPNCEVRLEDKVYDPDTRCGGHIDAIIVDDETAYVIEVKTYEFLPKEVKADSYWQDQISFYYHTVSDQGKWSLVIPVVLIVSMGGTVRVVEPKVNERFRETLLSLNMAWDSDVLPAYRDCRNETCAKCQLQRTCTEPIDTISEYVELVTERAIEEA